MSAPRTLRLELSASPSLAAAIVGAHGAAGACAALALPGPSGAALGAALLLLGAATAWSRALLRARGSVRRLDIEGTRLVVHLAGGESFPAQAGERRYVSRLMVTVPLARPRRTLLVTAGMLPPAEFRRLRVWALWGRLPPVAAAQPA